MPARRFASRAIGALLFAAVGSAFAQSPAPSLISTGYALLSQNKLHEAALTFQKAVDLNPSSAKAHEGLGTAIARQIETGSVRPSNDDDTVARAENHLKQAIDLAPSSRSSLNELASLESFLASRTNDPGERAERYRQAVSLLKQVIELNPDNARLYFALATIERDNFATPIQQASGRQSKPDGPIPDAAVRRDLQSQYGSIIEDAIANAKTASQMDGSFTAPLLLLSKIIKERALIRDTKEEFASDMHSAGQWRLQFLSAGGHIDHEER